MAFTIGKYGIGSLVPLAKLIGTFYLTSVLFVFVVLGADRAGSPASRSSGSSATSRKSC